VAKLSRPIDSDTKYYKHKAMEMGLYKFLVKGFLEVSGRTLRWLEEVYVDHLLGQ
jgi:hypothetical protein